MCSVLGHSWGHNGVCTACGESGGPVDSVRIAPGVYDGGDGSVHLVLDEMLEAHGYQDTEENRQTLIDAARNLFGSEKVIES